MRAYAFDADSHCLPCNSLLHSLAGCCSVLQRVVACCSVLPCQGMNVFCPQNKHKTATGGWKQIESFETSPLKRRRCIRLSRVGQLVLLHTCLPLRPVTRTHTHTHTHTHIHIYTHIHAHTITHRHTHTHTHTHTHAHTHVPAWNPDQNGSQESHGIYH